MKPDNDSKRLECDDSKVEVPKEESLIIVKTEDLANPPKNLVRLLRESRQYESEKLSIAKPNGELPSFDSIQLKISEISRLNHKIEDSIKMEILGLKDGLFNRVMFRIKSRIYRQHIEPVDMLFRRQITRVDEVASDVEGCSLRIDERLNHLEEHYSSVLFELTKKYAQAKDLRESMEGSQSAISKKMVEVEQSQNPLDRLNGIYTHRRARKALERSIHQLKLDDKAIVMLARELPVLDSLSSICEAYSFSLKETLQEVNLMNQHLHNVVSIYIEMMRSQRFDLKLEKEIKKLFSYTGNIVQAMQRGEQRIIESASQGGLLEKEHDQNRLSLGYLLNRIESANYSAFDDLERRVKGYLTNQGGKTNDSK